MYKNYRPILVRAFKGQVLQIISISSDGLVAEYAGNRGSQWGAIVIYIFASLAGIWLLWFCIRSGMRALTNVPLIFIWMFITAIVLSILPAYGAIKLIVDLQTRLKFEYSHGKYEAQVWKSNQLIQEIKGASPAVAVAWYTSAPRGRPNCRYLISLDLKEVPNLTSVVVFVTFDSLEWLTMLGRIANDCNIEVQLPV